MARVMATATTEGEEALAAATAETVLQLVAASNHPVAVLGWGVYFDGTSSTAEPAKIEIWRQTGAGTSSAGTPKEITLTGVTLQTASRHSFTAEPSSDDHKLDEVQVHPQGGYEVRYTQGKDEILIGSAGRLGIKITAPAVVNVSAKFVFEE